MTTNTTKMLAGVAVAALAAAGAAAVVNYRLGLRPDHDQRAHLEELDARLDMTNERPGRDARVTRLLEGLQRSQDVSVGRLRTWLAALRQGTLSPEQATVAESDFEALEREADRGGV